MPRITQEKLDFISDYLANHAEKDILTPELIDEYRERHKGRRKWGNKKWSANRYHRHGTNPFCNICDEELHSGDNVYVFCFFTTFGPIKYYHIDCFDTKAWASKQLSIIYQDRAFRKKYVPPEPEPEPEIELPEFYKPLREESQRLYDELLYKQLRKERGLEEEEEEDSSS